RLTRRLATEVAGRLQDLREKVSAAEKRLAAYQRANNLVSSSGVLVSDQDLTELNKQLNDARIRAARAKAKLDQIRRIPRNLGARGQTQVILNSPTLVQLQVRVADARRTLAELRRNLGEQHPDIKAARARVAETINAVSQEVARQREAIANEYEQMRNHERSLQARINELKHDTTQASEAMIGARELKRAVDANRKVYEEFLVRARELTEQQSIIPSSSRVVTKATPPARASNLPLSLLLVIGFLGGLPLGVGLAFLQQYINVAGSRLRPQGAGVPAAPEDTERESESYGAAANSNHAAHARQYAARSDRSRPAANSALDPGEIAWFVRATGLRRVTAPPDDLLEVSMALQRTMGEGRPNVTLVCDNGDPLSAANFAAGFSACLTYQGYDVLLADGDLYGADLAQELKLMGSPGLFDRFHKPAESLVMWNKAGLPHLLGSMPPDERRLPQGSRRFLAERLDDLADEVEYLVLYVGNLAENPFSGVLLETASQAVIIGMADRHSAANATRQLDLLADYGVPVIAELNYGAHPATNGAASTGSFESGDAPVVSTHPDGENDGNKKRRYFRRKRVVA
ncbi:MAG: hypothetical protein KDJ29_19650, partial [Hyphomicrobiales bacterium]|nr:hypothetical protein [Hyphomicrobiales bacterium]